MSKQTIAGQVYAIFSRRDLLQMLRFLDDRNHLNSSDVVILESKLVAFSDGEGKLQLCSDYTLRLPHEAAGTRRCDVPYLEKYTPQEPEELRFEDKHYPDGPQTLGKDLCPADQTEVLRSFVHRFTGEHRPEWAKSGQYAVQFKDDAEWLANTRFYTIKNGRLDRRCQSCESSPTWPFGKEAK